MSLAEAQPGEIPPPRKHTTIARAATLILVGQLASRLLGFTRDAVTAALFGQSGATDAFFAAQTISSQVHDLLVGTTITAALIPVFSEHADRKDLSELWRIANIVIPLAVLVLAGLAVVLELLAPQVMGVTVHFNDQGIQELAITLARIVMPAFIFLGLSGVISSLLYSMRNFMYSAFCVAAYNAAIVASALLFHHVLGVASLAVGMAAGSLLMVVIQLPPLIRQRMPFRPSLDIRHPEVRRIGRLYLPVAAGMVVTIIGVIVDKNLASRTGLGNISAMQYAVKIVQLPLGLISTALGMAILPTLSRHALDATLDQYKTVLTRGLKLALALIIPMLVAVLTLNNQILALVYQHGQYTASDRQLTSLALYIYAPQLPFVAIDYLLIAAFYALKNTLIPAALGVVGVCIYLAVALSLVGRFGMPALVLGNTVQNSLHGLILLALLWRYVGGLRGYALGVSVMKMLLAAAAMAGVCLASSHLLGTAFSLATIKGQLVQLALSGGLGLAVYFGLGMALRIEELQLGWQMVATRLRLA